MHKGGRPIGKEKESKGSSQKRKRDDEEDEDEDEEAQKGSKGGSRKEPKKFKRAFGFFVKAKRADAEARIGDPSVRHIPDMHAFSLYFEISLIVPTVQPSILSKYIELFC